MQTVGFFILAYDKTYSFVNRPFLKMIKYTQRKLAALQMLIILIGVIKATTSNK